MTETILQEVADLRRAVEQLTHVVVGRRLTRAEVCARVRVETHTLTRWIRQRRFPDHVGGYWLLQDVLEWERAKVSAPSSLPIR